MIVVAGPTGSGKSELALHLAGELDGEIVSCDSVQVYRRFDIGSAKLAPQERRGIEHHLIDVADPCQEYTAGEYSRQARLALGQIAARGKVGIFTGGTGFYLTALLEGLFPGPEKDARLRARLAAIEGGRPGRLHRILERLDRASARRIHPNDVNKVMRAIEVTLLGGQPMSEQFQAGREPLTGFQILKLGLNPDRERLHSRIEERTRRMYAQGLIEETRAILEAGYASTCKPFESLGYAQALEHLEGKISRDEAIAATALQTRQYAKRQWTWFRRDREMEWLDGFGDEAEVQVRAMERVIAGGCTF